jgi:hypothetical protein
MVALLTYYLLGGDQLAVLMALYFIASAFMGLVIPTTSVLALEEHGAIAGAASALLGTLQMLMGAIAMQTGGPVLHRQAPAHGGGHGHRRAVRRGADLDHAGDCTRRQTAQAQ